MGVVVILFKFKNTKESARCDVRYRDTFSIEFIPDGGGRVKVGVGVGEKREMLERKRKGRESREQGEGRRE